MSDRPGEGSRRGAPRGRPPWQPARARRSAGPTQARLIALRVLERVERTRAFADLALRAALARTDLPARDRALATDLVYGTLRWRGRIDYLLARVVEGRLESLELTVLQTLRLGAYQLLFCDRIPATAAVDESVRCVRAVGSDRAAGLVNAVLRRLAAESESIPLPRLDDDPLGHLTHALSLPAWLAGRWIDQYGASEAASLAQACNQVPPVTLRANRLRTSRDALLGELRERYPEAAPCSFAPDGILLGHHGPPGRDPAFLKGLCSIQDEASQLVVELLDPARGDRVLDACAAPGTKTAAIAERLGGEGEVVALDRHARRLDLVKRDLRRLGLSGVRTQTADLSRGTPGADFLGRFDRVLVDAPCTGLGTLRRNPDARWRLGPEDPRTLAGIQRAILENAARCLRPGGVLVYSTCTLAPEENEERVASILATPQPTARGELRLASVDEVPAAVRPLIGKEGFMRCLPHLHGTDGFFAARLERAR